MTRDGKLSELLDAAAADVPARHLAAPLGAIHARVRRRRRTVTVVAATVVVAVLVGGLFTVQWLAGRPAAQVPTAPVVPASPTEDRMAELPRLSAMVARDDTTVTVHAGAGWCEELVQPQATVTAEDASQVSISVTAHIVDAADCTIVGKAVPLTVTLAAPLGERTLVDAATVQPHPVYFERHLPDLRLVSRWTGADGSWPSDDVGWVNGYHGPAGGLNLIAYPTTSVAQGDPVEVITLGPYQGTITKSAFYSVSWEVGEVTYTLRLVPNVGGSFTLEQFKQELALLEWA